MKLWSKYYRVNVVATIIVVLFSSIGYYFIIHYILLDQLDSSLKVEEQEVIDHVRKTGTLPPPSSYKDQEVYFKPSTRNDRARKFQTLSIFDKEDREYVSVRQLVFPLAINGSTFDVFVQKSQEETEDLIQLILFLTLIVVLLLLIIIFLINRFMLRRLWKPFNSTLHQLKQFDLSGNNKLELEHSRIDEFNELNHAVSIMSKHVSQDYNALKSFTENASHELQTPLAIINSKLDLMIQGDNINEQQMEQLQDIYNALDRLSKLNQSLLLLTRMGNNQFRSVEHIDLAVMLQDKLQQFEEFILDKNFIVETDISPSKIECNRELMDIMLTNLLNNAIRYNIEGGVISVIAKGNELAVSNTSAIPSLDDQQIFQRFYRHADTQPEGNGLGLSIVKQVCDLFGFSVHYHFSGNMHSFRIRF